MIRSKSGLKSLRKSFTSENWDMNFEPSSSVEASLEEAFWVETFVHSGVGET